MLIALLMLLVRYDSFPKKTFWIYLRDCMNEKKVAGTRVSELCNLSTICSNLLFAWILLSSAFGLRVECLVWFRVHLFLGL